jgi:hypothetical protein
MVAAWAMMMMMSWASIDAAVPQLGKYSSVESPLRRLVMYSSEKYHESKKSGLDRLKVLVMSGKPLLAEHVKGKENEALTNAAGSIKNYFETRGADVKPVQASSRKETLRQFCQEPGNNKLLYFNGHGADDGTVVLHDGGLEVSELEHMLKDKEGSFTVIMVSCYSGNWAKLRDSNILKNGKKLSLNLRLSALAEKPTPFNLGSLDDSFSSRYNPFNQGRIYFTEQLKSALNAEDRKFFINDQNAEWFEDRPRISYPGFGSDLFCDPERAKKFGAADCFGDVAQNKFMILNAKFDGDGTNPTIECDADTMSRLQE